MSGFVVGLGNPDPKKIDRMMGKIRHRGNWILGTHRFRSIVMSQNYLRADLASGGAIPAAPLRGSDDTRICYDGQIGILTSVPGEISQPRLGNHHPYGTDENALLELYSKYRAGLLDYLGDGIFAFVISDGDNVVAARDLLGVKTLFYGREGDSLYLTSELKSLKEITDDVHEFPPGHWMNASGEFARFASLPKRQPPLTTDDIDHVLQHIREIVWTSTVNRVDFTRPTASLLSGGLDSSVVSTLADRLLKERSGMEATLDTFCIGVGETDDVVSARIIADQLSSHHHELIVDVEQVVEVLPEVIYHLESFDPSLVRSAATNYLISRYAAENGFEILLSGEGGDEIFCGYGHLKSVPHKDLFAKQIECLQLLHNNASLRLDRMNMAHSVRVVTPLISGELLSYSLSLPPEYKIREENGQRTEKWVFRKAYESVLPVEIVKRTKAEFSQGSGSATRLRNYCEETVNDDDFSRAKIDFPLLRSKEELFYFRIFTGHFGTGNAVKTVGQWIAL